MSNGHVEGEKVVVRSMDRIAKYNTGYQICQTFVTYFCSIEDNISTIWEDADGPRR